MELSRFLSLIAICTALATGNVPAHDQTPSTWESYQYDNDNDPVFPGDLVARWTFDTGGAINGSFGLSQKTLYVDSLNKRVFAIDLLTGKPRWIANVPNIAMSTPIVTHGLVIVGTGSNQVLEDRGPSTIWGRPEGDDVIALRQSDGSTAWRFHTIGEDMPTPVVVGDRLIFANGDMHAYALEVTTGKQVWSTPIPGIATMSSAAALSGLAFVVASHGIDYTFSEDATHMLGLDIMTGQVAWSAEYGNSDCSPTVSLGLVICEGSIYTKYGDDHVGTRGKNDINAYDLKTGKLAWRWIGNEGYFTNHGSNERGIAAMSHDGILYQAIPTLDKFASLRITDGHFNWVAETAAPVKMSALYWQGSVIFGDTAGLLYAFNAATGQLQNVLPYHDAFTTSAPVIVGKTLFIANGHSVIALPLSDLLP